MDISVGVSNHHVHLTKEDAYTLFGEGYELTKKRDLVQIGQFAAEETLTIVKNGKTLEHIRIIGPYRKYTQVELLDTDNEYFGIKAPVRTSGDLWGSETVDLIGPKGKVHAVESTIIADTHIHMSKDDLITFGRKNGETVSVEFENGYKMNNVHIKSDSTCRLELHINKDIATDNGIETGMKVHIC